MKHWNSIGLTAALLTKVIVPTPDSMSAGDARDHVAWLKSQLATTTQRGAGWVATSIGVDTQWLKQLRAAQRLVDPAMFANGNETYETPTNPLELRRQIVRSIAAGSRGISLRPHGPEERAQNKWPQTLEFTTLPGRAQVASLRWTINDLALWGPWIVAGQQVRAPTVNRNDYISNAWMLHNSYLVLVQKLGTDPASNAESNPASPLICATSVATTTRDVFRVTMGEYQRIESTAVPGGLQWTVNQPSEVEAFVISENPNVTRFVNRHLSETRLSVAEDQLELASYQLSAASEIARRTFPRFERAGSASPICTTSPRATRDGRWSPIAAPRCSSNRHRYEPCNRWQHRSASWMMESE